MHSLLDRYSYLSDFSCEQSPTDIICTPIQCLKLIQHTEEILKVKLLNLSHD